MAVSRFRPSGDTERQLRQLADKLNELIDDVNQESKTQGTKSDERIRIIEDADGTFRVEFKTKKGYITTGALDFKGE